MSVKERLKQFLKSKNISERDFAKAIEVSSGYVSAISKSIQPDKLHRISIQFPELNTSWLMTGEGQMVNDKAVSELKEKVFNSHIEVKVVTTKARAGFTESYYSEEYLEDMPSVMMEAEAEYHGKYLAFEVDGDSMEPEYHSGDIVICREIKRDLWRYKLHYDDWDFVIAHGSKGILLKQITKHNVETGDIVCHSLNSDMYPDFVLNLKEISFLYNVVEHRISGRNKRRYR